MAVPATSEAADHVLDDLVVSIRLSPIAGVIADARAVDMPIVGVNAAFCALTGYSEEEALGRNCRFLTGPNTEAGQRLMLREALAGGRPVLSELTNYRKNGQEFCNAVMIAPVNDAEGQPLYFVGSQMEVAGRGGDSNARKEQAEARVATLTPRQTQVLVLMTSGQRNKQIANALDIDEATVKLHRSLLLKKLGAKSSAEAVRLAVEAGLHLLASTYTKG